jgi:hypothetical protein
VAEPLREHELYRLGLHVRRGRGAPARQGGQLTPQPDFGRVQQ